MSDKLTPESLRDETALRLEIGRVLNPSPWEHDLYPAIDKANWRCAGMVSVFACRKCGQRIEMTDKTTKYISEDCGESTRVCHKILKCSIPDSFTGDLAVAAELLLRKCLEAQDLELRAIGSYAIIAVAIEDWTGLSSPDEQFAWWLLATPAERCEVCIRALQERNCDE